MSELSREVPVVLLEPNSHQLIMGAPEGRRRFLDWGVFHVEASYLELWRRYARAVKQRNAALRAGERRLLDGLDELLAGIGVRLSTLRAAYFEALGEVFSRTQNSAGGALRDVGLEFDPGWKGESLLAALRHARQRDLEQGASSAGPHRADLRIECHGQPARSRLSRGEQKDLAASLLLAQAELLQQQGEGPLVMLDDLASEFDEEHRERVLARARDCAGQVWVTGVERLAVSGAQAVFHVEHGTVREMV